MSLSDETTKGLSPIFKVKKKNPKFLNSINPAVVNISTTKMTIGFQERGNAKKLNKKSLNQKVAYLEKKYEEYLALLDKTDKEENLQQSKKQIEKSFWMSPDFRFGRLVNHIIHLSQVSHEFRIFLFS